MHMVASVSRPSKMGRGDLCLPINVWMNEMTCYLALKRNELLTQAVTQMNLTDSIPNKTPNGRYMIPRV